MKIEVYNNDVAKAYRILQKKLKTLSIYVLLYHQDKLKLLKSLLKMKI